MTALHPHDLERPDATIRYWSGGAGGAPTVVLLHGATLDHRAWAPQVDALRDRFQVVVPDLRGHGSSTGTFTFDAAVEDAVSLLDHLPARSFRLVGLSLGANIAQEVVRRRPDLVDALVVADATCNTAQRHPLAVSMAVGMLNAQAMLSGDRFARVAADSTAIDPQVRAYARQANAHRTNAETVAILASLLTAALRPDPAYRTPVPVLLIRGAQDHIGDIAADTAAWARREQLAYAVIPDAGHASNLDNPEAFTAELLSFLDAAVSPLQSIAPSPPQRAARSEPRQRRDADRPAA
jgi:3-oxoadipate enol-lactonase